MYIIQSQNRDSVLVETLPTIYANRSRAMFELMDIAAFYYYKSAYDSTVA